MYTRANDLVYRGSDLPDNRETSAMADHRGVYVTDDPQTAAQWGEVRAYRVTRQPRLFDLGADSVDARRFVASLLGEDPASLSAEEFDQLACSVFVQCLGVELLTSLGYDGYRLGHDAFWLGRIGDYAQIHRIRFIEFSEFQHELNEVVMRSLDLDLDFVEQELATWAAHVREWRRDAAYHDSSFPLRNCDRCGEPYRGPAVYCSFDCAVADAR